MPRLIYADWLEENDESWHAELIRLQIQLANGMFIAKKGDWVGFKVLTYHQPLRSGVTQEKYFEQWVEDSDLANRRVRLKIDLPDMSGMDACARRSVQLSTNIPNLHWCNIDRGIVVSVNGIDPVEFGMDFDGSTALPASKLQNHVVSSVTFSRICPQTRIYTNRLKEACPFLEQITFIPLSSAVSNRSEFDFCRAVQRQFGRCWNGKDLQVVIRSGREDHRSENNTTMFAAAGNVHPCRFVSYTPLHYPADRVIQESYAGNTATLAGISSPGRRRQPGTVLDDGLAATDGEVASVITHGAALLEVDCQVAIGEYLTSGVGGRGITRLEGQDILAVAMETGTRGALVRVEIVRYPARQHRPPVIPVGTPIVAGDDGRGVPLLNGESAGSRPIVGRLVRMDTQSRMAEVDVEPTRPFDTIRQMIELDIPIPGSDVRNMTDALGLPPPQDAHEFLDRYDDNPDDDPLA